MSLVKVPRNKSLLKSNSLSLGQSSNIKLNESYKGFHVEKKIEVSELKSQIFQLNHKRSGAKLIFISNKDTNKAFSIAFKTPPYDDTGVFHVFEHSVLAGSRKYPSKSLFFSLYASSLASELNASTHPVFTQYYYASKLEKDFSNLLEAYLDAVFYPNVIRNENIVKREGLRIEWKEKTKNFQYNGIVFNEMKGVFANPLFHLYKSVMKSLLFQTPYAFESGGTPEKIADLNFRAIKKAHTKYYHPDNCLIYLYGDLKIKKILSTIHENFLKNFNKRKTLKPLKIEIQETFHANKVLKSTYPVMNPKELKGKTFLSFNYLIGKGEPLEDLLSLDVLGSALFNEENSPGKKLIKDLNLAKEISFENFGSQENIVSLLLEGVSSLKDQKKIKNLIEKFLKETSEKGLTQNLIESTLNAKEFSLKEALFNSPNKGLELRDYIISHWIQKDYELKENFEWIKRFLKAKKELKNKAYVQSLIKKYFVENQKKSLVILSPNPNLLKKLDQKLNTKIKKALQNKNLEKLKKEDFLFNKWQKTKEPESITNKIPHLKTSSFSEEIEKIEYKKTIHKNLSNKIRSSQTKASAKLQITEPIEIYTFPQITGGINYIDLHFDLSHIPEKALTDLPILLYLLKKVNTKKQTFSQLTHLLNQNIGDLSFSIETFTPVQQPQSSIPPTSPLRFSFRPHLILSAKFLNHKSPVAFQLIEEILTQSLFEPEDQVKSLILEFINYKKTSITDRASHLARLSGEAHFLEASQWMTYINGHMAEKFLRKLEKDILKNKKAIKDLIQSLKKTFSLLFTQNNLQTALLVGEKKDLKALKECNKKLILNLKTLLKSPLNFHSNLKNSYPFKDYKPITGFEIPSQVQYAHMNIPYFLLKKKLSGKMYVFVRFLVFEYLLKVLREQNGAYGANATCNHQGIFSLSSYRDPKLKNTFNTFESFPKFFDSLNLDQKSLDPYIVGSLKAFYQPKSPYGKARHFLDRKLIGLNEKDYQRIKKEILSTTVKDIQKINTDIKKVLSKAKKTVAGEKEKIAKEAPFIKEKMAL